MQKEHKENGKLLLQTEEDMINTMLGSKHPYRKVKKLLPLHKIVEPLRELYSKKGQEGIPVEKGFAAILLQFWEDLSDRQMERALQENVAVRWFCGFGLTEETPDHSYFGKLRKRIGTERVVELFNKVKEALEKAGVIGGVFTFVDATGIVSKLALWEERDKAIAEGEEQLNNANVNKHAKDKDARYGCKGKDKFWFGYKRQVGIDMKQGMIIKAFADPANVPDSQALLRLVPETGMVLGDKGYGKKEIRKRLKARGIHDGILRKDNDREKNKDRDRWVSKVRMPFENVFSRKRRRARYVGLVKVQFQVTMEALSYNLKRLIAIDGPPLMVGA